MLQVEVTDRWYEVFAGGHVGVLLLGNVDNAKRATPLDQRKRDIEARLRQKLESVVHKGKSLPNVSPLVDANFAAELEILILTAGHDADLLAEPISIDATQGGEEFIQMNGAVQILKPNDMMMADSKGIICTIIYGQDQPRQFHPRLVAPSMWRTRQRESRSLGYSSSLLRSVKTSSSLHPTPTLN